MEKTKRRLLLYTPGLLSLIILFPICYGFLKKQFEAREKAVIELNMHTPRFGNLIVSDTLSYFYGFDPVRPYPKRNYFTYYLTGQDNQDKATLNEAQVVLRKQHLSKDTISGVHFYFTNDVKYGALVNTLNILLIEGVERFLFVDNEIWVFNIPETDHQSVSGPFCDTSRHSISRPDSRFHHELIIDRDTIVETSKRFWLPFLLLIALVYLNVQSII